MNQFIEHADIAHPSRFPFLIVGNKQDLQHDTKVSESKVRSWCESKGNLQNIQTSAKVYYKFIFIFSILKKIRRCC